MSISSVEPTAKILATFTGTNGASPEGSLIEDSAGNLYGTTSGGGANSDGTAFEIPKTPTGYGTLITLASFNNSFIGDGPQAGLVADSAGDLFGTTLGGGANNAGSVFEIAKGATAPTILASFNFGASSTTTGEGPEAGLIMDSAGDLFGTTRDGGAYGDGAVFEVPKSSTSHTEYGPLTLVASFNYTDGDGPRAGLTTDIAGDLFGTTFDGGTGYGTVFEIKKTGSVYATTPTTLVSFNGSNGSVPLAGLITDSAGDLFGTTSTGGPNGSGTVFEIKKTGGVYATTPTVLLSFTPATGDQPASGLIMDAAGDLFGTTPGGGPGGGGTVFELKIASTSTGYASTPIIVSGSTNLGGSVGSLLADSAGDLFAPAGGGLGNGTVFEITNSGFVTATPTPPPQTITLAGTSNTSLTFGQDVGDTFIFAGTSLGNSPTLQFLGTGGTGSNNTTGAFILNGTPASSAPAFGNIIQNANANVVDNGGFQITDGTLSDTMASGTTLAIGNTSTLANGGTLSISSGGKGTFSVNGTINLSTLGTNVLNLKDANVAGSGMVNQQGENDTTTVSSVTGTDFQINSGVLALENPTGFNGTIGPASDGQAIGILGEVDIFNAPSVTKASFDTTTGMLSLFNSAGGDVGNIHFAGTATGLRLGSATFGGAHLAITDGSTYSQGNIPLTFHT